ncbi:MAG: class I SAM-dependent methyltransferase [Desulfobulbaceae bacterium]|nr:class I SAM-dependent methyltransferase [Desulfobulbaceae bacterium]
MTAFNENDLSTLLMENTTLRLVEPNIYSVLPNNESGNEYDTQFGFIYDLVACNPIYNRLIWGYSVKIFPQVANDALRSTSEGYVLDLGCGSLAFTAKAYTQNVERPVVLADQSLKMLRMAKSRLIKLNGKVPDNLVFLHSDARHLPFRKNAFTTIISENLLHCLDDTSFFLKQIKEIISKNGKIYFTTLVKSNRLADKYLQALADSGKLISRTVADHKEIFKQIGLAAKYESTGNILLIQCDNNRISEQTN